MVGCRLTGCVTSVRPTPPTPATRRSTHTPNALSVIGSGTFPGFGVFIAMSICVAASTMASSCLFAIAPFSGSSTSDR